ncbi:MAG: ABC transporter ATP-binding protein [Deltaproteobacteria bacterium]|nr:ABC transporter ATP-binding protein [Deltaproteobacteria bacterium]
MSQTSQPSAPADNPEIVLESRELVRTLGDKVKQVILDHINLQVHRGEFVALTGHSGSGKSTLLYLLGILDKPTSGQVLIAGEDASRLNDDERAALRNSKLGFVFQFHFLLPEFSVLENVMVPMLRRGVPDAKARAMAMDALNYLGLHELSKRRPSELSGGQQQRVSIARAIAGKPTLLLADEPTGNLDSKNAELVMAQFETLNREQGTTLIMVTHDPAFATRASRQVILKDGKIISDVRHQKQASLQASS